MSDDQRPAAFGSGPVEIGSPMQTVGLTKFKAEGNTSYLVNPLVDEVWPFLTGFQSGVGHLHAFDESGVRKEMMDKIPEWRPYFVMPALIYRGWVHQQRKLMSKDVEFVYIRLNERTYKDVFENHALLGGSAKSIDWLITCDNPEYQRLAFQQANTRRWPKFGDDTVKAAKAYMVLFRKMIGKAMGQKMTSEQFFKALLENSPQFETAQVGFDPGAQTALPDGGGDIDMGELGDGMDDFLDDQPVEAKHEEAKPEEEFPFDPAVDAEAPEDRGGDDSVKRAAEESEEDLGIEEEVDDGLGLDPEPEAPAPAKKAPPKKAAPKKAAAKKSARKIK